MSTKLFPDKIITSQYEFHVVRPEHYQLLHRWLNTPHVAKFWDGAVSMSEVIGKYDHKIHLNTERAYFVKQQQDFIGYISVYIANKVGGAWWEEEEDGTLGVDLLIGEESLLGKGLGASYLVVFTDWLLEQKGVKKIITDPSPKNLSAIKSYQKAGFVNAGLITTPDGEAMVLEKVRGK